MLWEVSGSFWGSGVFYSIPRHVYGSLINALTISSRPGDPRGLIYQNFPKVRLFWPFGKPQERFQSWLNRFYFIAVTVGSYCRKYSWYKFQSAEYSFWAVKPKISKWIPVWLWVLTYNIINLVQTEHYKVVSFFSMVPRWCPTKEKGWQRNNLSSIAFFFGL